METRVERWLTDEVCALPDGPARLVYLPGAATFGMAQAALFGAVRQIQATSVFVAGPGATGAAIWASRSGATVTTWHDSIAEQLSLRSSFAVNGLPLPQMSTAWDFAGLPLHRCGLSLLHLPRGRDLQVQLIRLSASVLEPGGRMILVGATQEGVRGALDEARRVCGRAGVVNRKGGYHAVLAYAPEPGISPPHVVFDTRRIEVAGQSTELVSCVGVFANDRLDVGAAALIEAMVVAPGTVVLDLGCGTGLVGLAAARRGARLIATDVSARAVAGTRRTLAANGYPDAVAHLCPGAAAVPDGSVDTVVTNPPFHRGHDTSFDVSQLFVREAARVLKPGGRVFLVANTFLDYRPWLEKHFGSVGVAAEGHRFRVWRARL